MPHSTTRKTCNKFTVLASIFVMIVFATRAAHVCKVNRMERMSDLLEEITTITTLRQPSSGHVLPAPVLKPSVEIMLEISFVMRLFQSPVSVFLSLPLYFFESVVLEFQIYRYLGHSSVWSVVWSFIRSQNSSIC